LRVGEYGVIFDYEEYHRLKETEEDNYGKAS